ncbi:hypothetical protein A0H81_01496 [Grifola frondosa]|uniref:Uncharacterized protein n=1 Tax=Grifola frondosa TaxID=5627 RepID=A0A1C7MSF4_GRIFR|nr:hypothetical protein A0H81_01496 [Grifola frondosa]
MTLEDLLEKTPEERVDIFADLIGAERIICFNNEIARRIEAMQLPPSSPSNEQYSSHSSVHAPELPENEGYIYT